MTDVAPQSAPPKAAHWLERRTRWLVTKPLVVVGLLAVLGVAIWHVWLTTLPLSSGDWNWESSGSIRGYFPFPSVWNSTLGLSGENRFADIFRFPILAVGGFLSVLGFSWSIIEKLLYFIPFAVAIPVAGWLLAREILGKTRWTLLAPVLLLGNAYLVLEANTEIPLALAEAVGCLALVAFIRAMRRASLPWSLGTGLLLALTATIDIRPAYLTVLMIIGFFVVLSIAEPNRVLFRRRAFLLVATGAVFVGSQAFWIVPILTYHGHAQLPIPPRPNFNILTLEHGLAGVSALWTGGRPAALVQAPLNPLFMMLPIVAMLPLLRRRMKAELLWLALVAVVAAFLSKTNNPPLGGLYNFMYQHIPGFNLFREGSKFLYAVAIAYAVLIPAALQSLVEVRVEVQGALRRAASGLTAVLLILMLGIAGSVLLVLEQGKLGVTTSPVQQPAAFSDVAALLHADRQPGAVLWFGSPIFSTDAQQAFGKHHYVISTALHPAANLTGDALTAELNRRDQLQYFCPVITRAYCYVTPSLFPYLVGVVGASYIISPDGADVGKLPTGVTRQWLNQQLRGMYGTPMVLGKPGSQLFVWHLAAPPSAVTSYPAVALVDSGPWSLQSVVPALQSMGVPAVYRQSLGVLKLPATPASLPDAIGVVPRVNGGCQGTLSGQDGIMAHTTAPTLPVSVGGRSETLHLLSGSTRLPGWGVYGPTFVPAGLAAIATSDTSASLGPCIAWSQLAAAAFRAPTSTAAPVRIGANGERVTATATAAPGAWIELRRQYDPGWRLRAKPATAVASGLFNLYYAAHPPAAGSKIVFNFSTHRWERIGQVFAILAVIATLLLMWRGVRRERLRPPVWSEQAYLESRVAPLLGYAGIALLSLTAVATAMSWFGVPSRVPWTSITRDPYRLNIFFGTLALAVLALSMAFRMGEQLARTWHIHLPAFSRGPRRGAAVAVAATLAVSGCAGAGQNLAQSLSNAQQSGAQSHQVVGASLNQATVQAQERKAEACIASYTKALKIFPRLVSAYYGRAECYEAPSQDGAGAVHDLDKALALSPDNALLLLSRARAERGISAIGSAIRDYRASAYAPASTPRQILAATDGLIEVGQLATASEVVTMATARFPNNAIIRLVVADLGAANGNDAQTTAALTSAVAMAKSVPSDLAFTLGRMCSFDIARLQFPAAATVCQRSVDAGQAGGSGAYENLSTAQVSLGQLTPAIRNMTNAIGSYEGSVRPNAQPAGINGFGLANLLEARGRLHIENGQPQLAVDDFRSALAVLPGKPDITSRLKSEIKVAQE